MILVAHIANLSIRKSIGETLRASPFSVCTYQKWILLLLRTVLQTALQLSRYDKEFEKLSFYMQEAQMKYFNAMSNKLEVTIASYHLMVAAAAAKHR